MGFAELVCSNSFRSDDAANNAVGLLHAEMRRLGSLIMRSADANQVPAGGALAVDRDGFSAAVTKALQDHPLIEIRRAEIAGLPPADWRNVIVATGPLTSAPLADAIRELTDENALAFFDAIAPIVHRDSIDMSVAWFQSRYDKVGPGGTGADYINCPMTKEQYDGFVAALIAGEKTDFKEWETNTPYFDGCLPIEVMAERGRETLRHGPMKPVGLTNPHNPDREGLRHRAAAPGQQARHALQHGRFPDQAEARRAAARVPHHSRARERRIRPARRAASQHLPEFAEAAGYAVAAARRPAAALCRTDDRLRRLCGIRRDRPDRRPLCRGRCCAPHRWRRRRRPRRWASLLGHITGGHIETIDAGPRSFQPMNINFGLFPPLANPPTKKPDGTRLRGNEKTVAKKQAISARALADLDRWIADSLQHCGSGVRPS